MRALASSFTTLGVFVELVIDTTQGVLQREITKKFCEGAVTWILACDSALAMYLETNYTGWPKSCSSNVQVYSFIDQRFCGT